MRYVAYYRVSTQEQGRSGLGLDAQQKAVDLHVRSRNAELIAGFTEVESGKKADRPQLELAIEMAVNEGAVLLIAKLDRLARSVHFISTLLLDPKLEIEACDLPAANKMTMQIMAAVAEGEAAAISQRTKAALEQAAARGKKFGFAHENNRARASQLAAARAVQSKIEADRRSAELGKIIQDMRDAGLTFDQIAERFTALRIPMVLKKPVRGVTKWSKSRIYQIYRRYTFVGPVQHGYVALPAPDGFDYTPTRLDITCDL